MRRSDSEIPPRRASDADREHAVRVLRDAAVDGRLTHDSFVWRVDQALRARHDESLAALVADLAPQHAVRTRLIHGLTSLADRLRPDIGCSELPLPDSSAPVLVIGRRSDCDVVVDDDVTSRVHAALMLYAGRWYVTDRGSTNGTYVNGRRIWGTATVHAGDRVTFGRSTFQLVRPTPANQWDASEP